MHKNVMLIKQPLASEQSFSPNGIQLYAVPFPKANGGSANLVNKFSRPIRCATLRVACITTAGVLQPGLPTHIFWLGRRNDQESRRNRHANAHWIGQFGIFWESAASAYVQLLASRHDRYTRIICKRFSFVRFPLEAVIA